MEVDVALVPNCIDASSDSQFVIRQELRRQQASVSEA